jgi:Acyl-CoA carboxylase epsilon subunit
MGGTEDGAAETGLRIVRGEPSPQELAALVTVVAALGSAGGEEAPRRTSDWAHPRHHARRPLHPGPGAWRASGLPL